MLFSPVIYWVLTMYQLLCLCKRDGIVPFFSWRNWGLISNLTKNSFSFSFPCSHGFKCTYAHVADSHILLCSLDFYSEVQAQLWLTSSSGCLVRSWIPIFPTNALLLRAFTSQKVLTPSFPLFRLKTLALSLPPFFLSSPVCNLPGSPVAWAFRAFPEADRFSPPALPTPRDRPPSSASFP